MQDPHAHVYVCMCTYAKARSRLLPLWSGPVVPRSRGMRAPTLRHGRKGLVPLTGSGMGPLLLAFHRLSGGVSVLLLIHLFAKVMTAPWGGELF